MAWLLSASIWMGMLGGIPASTAGGFQTNLDNLRGLQGSWTEQSDGLRAVGSGDCFAMSDTVADDFIYEADVTISTTGAALLVFRPNETGSQAYVANVDLSRGDARLFKFSAQERPN